ncbi:MAG: hypothetical protein MH252_08500 [Thermosynechococcaceae cyanobacterium MS004]|nr:hypothetical protein [Thermosynechococcaceae cyanobacterium MS004]
MPAKKAAAVDELEVLFPEQLVETSAGKFVVHPFYVKDFTAVLDLVKSYKGFATDDTKTILEQVLERGDEGLKDVMRFIQMCCSGASDEQLMKLRMDELVDLFMAGVEANRDFLFQRIQQSGLRFQLATTIWDGQKSLED